MRRPGPRPPGLVQLGLAAALAVGGCVRVPGALVDRREPSAADLPMAQAAAQEQAGAVEASLETLRSAIEADPADVRPHLRYVAALVALGRRAQAAEEYAARAEAPEATGAERTLAARLATNGASSALRRVYGAAAIRDPADPWWQLALAEVEIAEADAWNRRRRDAIDRGDRVEEQRAFAQSRGALRRADVAVEAAAERDAALPEVHCYRGLLRALEGDVQASPSARQAAWRAAEAALATAVAADPDLVEAWRALADVRFRLGALRDSLVAWIEAVRRAPADADLRVGLGVVLHELGRLREAAAQYREAASLRAWDADPLLRLGDALADAHAWGGALEAYDKALVRDPDAVAAHEKRGVVLLQQGRHGEARAAFERYVNQGGPRADAVRRRIERLLRLEAR